MTSSGPSRSRTVEANALSIHLVHVLDQGMLGLKQLERGFMSIVISPLASLLLFSKQGLQLLGVRTCRWFIGHAAAAVDCGWSRLRRSTRELLMNSTAHILILTQIVKCTTNQQNVTCLWQYHMTHHRAVFPPTSDSGNLPIPSLSDHRVKPGLA